MFFGVLYTPLSTSSQPHILFTRSKKKTPFLQYWGNWDISTAFYLIIWSSISQTIIHCFYQSSTSDQGESSFVSCLAGLIDRDYTVSGKSSSVKSENEWLLIADGRRDFCEIVLNVC